MRQLLLLLLMLILLAGCEGGISYDTQQAANAFTERWPGFSQVGPTHFELRPHPNVYCLVVYSKYEGIGSATCVNTTEGGR